MNKTYLKLALDFDFLVIAITASLKDYILCHKVNNSLEFEFEKVGDHEVFYNVDEEPLAFSKYYYFVEQGEIEYFLVANRTSDGFLVPEMNKVDFFMVIRPGVHKEDVNFILTRLNKLADIQVAAQIDAMKLKSKENLIM